jgi:pimeloyl-ACP methyl ester carboxylesterase
MQAFTREWGSGAPVLALHPLALESSAFERLGPALAARGLRLIAVDLPGFGRTPAPDAPLTPARLAAPVLELAGALGARPALVGISMGGRVALEAALRAPELFRAVVPVAPYLPWRRHRWAFGLARLFSPALAEKIPVELAWPALRWITDQALRSPFLADDAVLHAGVRMVYYSACPATRRALVSATREMALDPAFGPRGLWTRLRGLRVPATFVWGEQDRLVPVAFARPVAETLPAARQVRAPCLGHALQGPHATCLAELLADALLAPGAALASPWPCRLEAPAGAPAHGHAPA